TNRQRVLKRIHGKYEDLADALTLWREGVRDRDYVVQSQFNQGFDLDTAELTVRAQELKRSAGIRDNALSALIRSYVDREIDLGEFNDLLQSLITHDVDQEDYRTVAFLERRLNVKHLSHAR